MNAAIFSILPCAVSRSRAEARSSRWTRLAAENKFSTISPTIPDGASPNGGLLPVADGFVGTSFLGGANCSTVFKLTAPAVLGEPWTESVIYTFAGANERMQRVCGPGK